MKCNQLYYFMMSHGYCLWDVRTKIELIFEYLNIALLSDTSYTMIVSQCIVRQTTVGSVMDA